ncbi:MAG: hypothetical protein R2788_23570 [Saprospiraceae bacterium]
MKGLSELGNAQTYVPKIAIWTLNRMPVSDAIENALQNPYFDIITDLVCNEQSHGLFQQADNTGLGLNDGLLLTTGVGQSK